MKNALKVSTILSWFNLIVWGLFAGLGLLGGLFGGNLVFLTITVITGFIVLHSYAALQLHKSIRNPSVPLSSQTPVGIRFIGFVALFLGVLYIGDGVGLLQNTRDVVKMMEPQLPPQAKDLDLNKLFKATGAFSLVAGACIAVNVFLSFRLLRWYLFLRENDIH
ncbi:MAG TPA: hypothetical protein VF939_12945 [Puia sp.]